MFLNAFVGAKKFSLHSKNVFCENTNVNIHSKWYYLWFIKACWYFSSEPYIVPFDTAVFFYIVRVMAKIIIMHITSNNHASIQ